MRATGFRIASIFPGYAAILVVLSGCALGGSSHLVETLYSGARSPEPGARSVRHIVKLLDAGQCRDACIWLEESGGSAVAGEYRKALRQS